MSYDDPRTWGANPKRLQWEVYPVDRKGKQCGSSVYVAAENHERALACGKYWRRMLSLKPAKNVEARRYYPERDPYMVACGFVKLTPNASLTGSGAKEEHKPEMKDWGLLFMADTELDAMRIAYAYRNNPHGTKVDHCPAVAQFMVTIWNERAKAMGCDV